DAGRASARDAGEERPPAGDRERRAWSAEVDGEAHVADRVWGGKTAGTDSAGGVRRDGSQKVVVRRGAALADLTEHDRAVHGIRKRVKANIHDDGVGPTRARRVRSGWAPCRGEHHGARRPPGL